MAKKFLMENLYNIYNLCSRAQASFETIEDCLDMLNLYQKSSVENKVDKITSMLTQLVLIADETIKDEPFFNPYV